jgi:hypothetical protein
MTLFDCSERRVWHTTRSRSRTRNSHRQFTTDRTLAYRVDGGDAGEGHADTRQCAVNLPTMG